MRGRILWTLPVLLVLGMAVVSAASPAMPEQFDTKYPVCMEVYASSGPRFDCYFWTMAQCWKKTDGMAALCVANRSYVPAMADAPAGRIRRGYY